MYGVFLWLLSLVAVQSRMVAGMLFVMGWPQLVTSVAGGILAATVVKRLGGQADAKRSKSRSFIGRAELSGS